MELVHELISQYGYLIVFVNLILGLVGLPVPDEILLLAVGYLTKFGSLHYGYALIISFAGAFSGMFISFVVGKKAGQPLTRKLSKWLRVKEKSKKRVKKFMAKYGHLSILIGCFIPGFRQIISYFCGTSNMKMSVYTMYTSIGAFSWCLVFITVGRLIGHL